MEIWRYGDMEMACYFDTLHPTCRIVCIVAPESGDSRRLGRGSQLGSVPPELNCSVGQHGSY